MTEEEELRLAKEGLERGLARALNRDSLRNPVPPTESER